MLVGVIDVASDVVETPEQVADTIGTALQYVPKNRLFACTNCGMAPMDREVALKKLHALAQGAQLAAARYGLGVFSAPGPRRGHCARAATRGASLRAAWASSGDAIASFTAGSCLSVRVVASRRTEASG